jgi:uncharacterized protein (DUF1501 family)
MTNIDRRLLLRGAVLTGGALLGARFAFGASAPTDARLICILLRGALDGLSAVPPHGDRDYARLRRELAIAARVQRMARCHWTRPSGSIPVCAS